MPTALCSDWDSLPPNCPAKVGTSSLVPPLQAIEGWGSYFDFLLLSVTRPVGAVAVAEFIADSPRLLRLDLRENEIKTGGLMALSLALKVNTSLLRLDLDREPKKETVSMWGWGGSQRG